jgi:hypothetical protein
MDEVPKPVLDRLIGGHRDGVLAALPLNSARMSNTALFAGWFVVSHARKFTLLG